METLNLAGVVVDNEDGAPYFKETRVKFVFTRAGYTGRWRRLARSWSCQAMISCRCIRTAKQKQSNRSSIAMRRRSIMAGLGRRECRSEGSRRGAPQTAASVSIEVPLRITLSLGPVS